MKLTVIGYWHGYPEPNEATSGFLVEKDGFRLLIDCGSGVVSQLQSYCAVTDLDAVILSHYHHDHMADIGVLQYARLIQYYMGYKGEALSIYGHMLDKEKFNQLSYPPHVNSIPYDPNKRINIGPFTVSFKQTKHPAPCFAMRISEGANTIVYTADTSYIEELVPFSSECDLLIAESSFYENQDASNTGHMNSKEAATLAEKSGAKELLLTHLPHFGELSQLKKEAETYFNGPVHLAEKGWSYTAVRH
ncbi:MBL fold metallo-hydrolase [Bacillus sp. FJAT-45350]|uniref:MBL fold metallo-hydrolase n=1 Tax=Bacillus sp. FJAT-45350 TaxID=2011014 RepID=UPI000BB902CE|nr:MBL fold metallo-hydrolase [Bacillus sp. FJAT-45350]